MRTLICREHVLNGVLPGGASVRLDGFVGLHRSGYDGQLVFTAILKATIFGSADPVIVGRKLLWTEMSHFPDALALRVMDQTDGIEKLMDTRGQREAINDFLVQLSGRLFRVHEDLLTIVHRKRCARMRYYNVVPFEARHTA